MGRIKNDSLYIFDNFVSKFDKVIGSDAENSGRTKNYLLGDLFALFSALGGGGAFGYTYTADLADLDIIEGLVATNNSETNPDGVNLFRFSRTDAYGNDLRTLAENYSNNSDGVVLKVTSEADPNLISAYTITGINVNTNWVEISVLGHKNLNTLTFAVGAKFSLTFDLVNLDGSLQNNIITSAFYGYISPDFPQNLTSRINARGLTIEEDEIHLAYVLERTNTVNISDVSVKVYVVTEGKGTYNITTPLLSGGVFLLSSRHITQDLLVEGITIDLGDIGADTIEDNINSLVGTSYNLLENTLYFFTTIESTIPKTYLYIGAVPVTIGDTGTPVASTDFSLIAVNGVDVNIPITSTQQISNEGADGTSTYVEADEISNIPLMPPYLRELVPDTYLPSTTGNFILRGSFFTSDMVITIEGHTINYQTFVSSNEFVVNLTTSATEGEYDVTLNNGLEAIYADQLQVVNGTVYQPTNLDWILPSGSTLTTDNDNISLSLYGVSGKLTWNRELDYTKNWILSFSLRRSPLGDYTTNTSQRNIQLNHLSTPSTILFDVGLRDGQTPTPNGKLLYRNNNVLTVPYAQPTLTENWNLIEADKFEYKWISGVMYLYVNGVLKWTFSEVATENLRLTLNLQYYDVANIKYIDLTDTGGGYVDYSKLISQFVNDSNYIKISDLTQYADDTAAGVGGVAVGEAYISSTTGAIQVRLT